MLNRKKQIVALILLLGLLLWGSCKSQTKEQGLVEDNKSKTVSLSEETLYRPNFHFTPRNGWMNDPNGMFFYNGYFHLYFQHYPDDSVWGPMHWGLAISGVMVTWKEQPIALYPDELGYIFSGSAVVDHDNTTGFGRDGIVPIISMYTYHDEKGKEAGRNDYQTQGIAYSLDEGLTWIKYEGNPVIKNPKIKDFRDPKISWDAEHEKWIMVLAAGDKTMFYASKDLKNWQLLSDFGQDIGAHGGVWECPDLFPLKVQGSNESKWVLLVSINPGGPNGGSATQYFIGDFDGRHFNIDDDFKTEMQKDHDFWVDFGKDNYAGVTWSNTATSDGGKLFMGWMSNWQYAKKVPTEKWRSAMTVARELRLVKTDKSYRLVFEPVDELKEYKGKKFEKDGITLKDGGKIIDSKSTDLTRALIKFNISDVANSSYNFKLSNKTGDELTFGYNHNDKSFYIDRKKAGKTDFSENFRDKISTAPRISNSENLNGTFLLDKTSIELFYDDGKTVMTEIFFPNAPFETITVASDNEEFVFDHIEIHELNFN